MKKNDCIFFQFAKTYQLSSRFLAQKVSELNLTSVQAMVLGFLTEEDQITSRELGKRTELDSATLTGILDRLEAAEFLERKSNPDDRRSIHIHLTPKGKAMGREASRVIVEANAEFLQVLTEEQKRDLHSIISTLRLNVPRP
ncbi:MAG: MarR family transcriptional regulator [Smithella sp.]|jgi:DNA-binding MarR family transcriptional regulator|nr:MarR family transcriptional regulator [Syntrophaceae bacterium]NMC90064.1 MarR family transcriptional regulator [Smithella sp.]HNV57124.1 MarR family transcriptional regulator [Smithellaceae bacterium]HNY96337.1 MarR family transcriptional regulator [Smithellaceae bacterium]HOD64198.1 MarR family transcriptional regulator [Smithellaceae bacterium]